MALRHEITLLAAKQEADLGVAESLTAAEAAFNAFDVSIDLDLQLTERMGQAGLGRLAAKKKVQFGRWKASFELSGPGTASGHSYAPLWARTFFPACRMIDNADGSFERTLLTPAGSGTADRPRTLTICRWEDGRLKLVRGAAGTWTLSCPDPNGIPMVNFEGIGLYDAVADDELPAWTAPVEDLIRFEQVDIEIGGSGGYVPAISTFELALGGVVEPRGYAAAAGGFSNCRVVRDDIRGKIDPEALLVATYALHAAAIAETELEFAMTIGTAVGQKLTIEADAVQFGEPTDGQRGETLVDETPFQVNGDALTLTFG